LLAAITVPSAVAAADPPLVDGVSGAPVSWADWIAKRGPVGLLFWASWAPDATTIIQGYGDLAKACRTAGYELVVVGVQESLEDGREALGGTGITWIHDRHGALLKQYRVIQIPSLAVVSAEGKTLARLDPTVEAVNRWEGP
jgi:hypothetical protein